MTISKAVVQQRLTEELPQWNLNADDSGICRIYMTSGWKSSLMLANAIGFLAESGWHHPEILVRYSSVRIDLTTHSEGGITEKDFALAKQIDKLLLWQPQDGVLQTPPAKYSVHKVD